MTTCVCEHALVCVGIAFLCAYSRAFVVQIHAQPTTSTGISTQQSKPITYSSHNIEVLFTRGLPSFSGRVVWSKWQC